MLNKLEENLFTTGCLEAPMDRNADGAVKTFTQHSAAISPKTKQLKD